MPLIAVCAAWAVFWGSWSALLPAVKLELGVSAADLGPALSAVPVGAMPAMALTGRLARSRERTALLAVTAAFALSVAGVGPAGSLGADVRTVLAAVAAIILVTSLSVLTLRVERGPVASPEHGDRGRVWRTAAVLGALAACALIIENAVEQWSVLLLEEHRGASPLVASAAPSVSMAMLTAGRLVAQALPRLSLRTMYLVAGAGGGAGMALAGLGGHVWTSPAGFAVTGLALGPLVPALLSRASVDDPSGTLVWGVSTISYTAFVAGPLLVAALNGGLGLPAALAVLGLLGLPLVARFAAERP
ncbi:hypothetical protein [Nonomuraea sp. NPDC050783]|uniref:hypothetical protein n=1 Tax=Nonomuraea sp. NPDC050783 TaxID=3154634 RepID=UPI00346702CF